MFVYGVNTLNHSLLLRMGFTIMFILPNSFTYLDKTFCNWLNECFLSRKSEKDDERDGDRHRLSGESGAAGESGGVVEVFCSCSWDNSSANSSALLQMIMSIVLIVINGILKWYAFH